MDTNDLKKWLVQRKANLNIRVLYGEWNVEIFNNELYESAEATELEEAIRCAQHLFDSSILGGVR